MGLDVEEIDFRYPGPKPQTKIAAIVMLADGCEAATRANIQSGRIQTGMASPIPGSPSPSPNNKQTTIAEVCNKIIDDRLRDHQLDECNLTLRDIDEIRRLFVQILTDIYHPRINYPDSHQATNKVDPTTIPVEQREGVVVTALPLAAPTTVRPTETHPSLTAPSTKKLAAASSEEKE
jgi:hypothetical protein